MVDYEVKFSIVKQLSFSMICFRAYMPAHEKSNEYFFVPGVLKCPCAMYTRVYLATIGISTSA